MNAVGIDVSKGKSTVAVLRPLGELVHSPFDVVHNPDELEKLVILLKSLDGESRVVMEYTGNYYEPIARFLHNNALFVSVVNPILVNDYGYKSLRKIKTDNKDALKLASFVLDRWLELPRYSPEGEIRALLKSYNQHYNRYMKLKVILKNNLISLLDLVFPGANTLFSSPACKSDGHEKWIDFVPKFPHSKDVFGKTFSAFSKAYFAWCRKSGYNFSEHSACIVYDFAASAFPPCRKTQVPNC